MQNQTPKHEIRKRSLGANTTLALFNNLSRQTIDRLSSVFLRSRCARWWALARLHPQRGRKDELANSGGEAGEEGVERIVSSNNSVEELDTAN